MQRHAYFDLWLHDDTELGAITGCALVERTTLHEWPLSCVQRLVFEDGQTAIYKVQAEPTVEPDFYRRARSSLLVRARLLPVDGMPPALLLEDVHAPRLSDLKLSRPAAHAAVDAILTAIAKIEGGLPAAQDIRTRELWLAQAQWIHADVRALVEAGAFQQVDQAMASQIAGFSRSRSVLAAIEDGPTGYVHTDLSGDNVLVPADGYRVVDWQRPIWGPTALDRFTLLESLGVEAPETAPPGVDRLRKLLLIGWVAQAARYWYPPGVETYDRVVARMVRELETDRVP